MRKLHNTELMENKEFKIILEKYPHIGKKIDIFWGSEFCAPYLESLFVDTRSGSRKGFPYDDILLLLKLKTLHEFRFKMHVKTDVWDYTN